VSRVNRTDCEALDRADPLAGFRDRFALPDGVIYLDGNSLGALPRATPSRLARVIEDEWGRGLIRSWNTHGWINLAQRIGHKIARLIGAAPATVMTGDSTSVNVFKALSAAIELRPERRVIVSERGNFPTDLYIAEGLAALLGRGHELRLVEPDGVAAALDERVAALMLTQVDYRTGRMLDMASVTTAAHDVGAIAVWDLAHSAGAVPLDVAAAGADFAVGCGYKYLNGGPGAPAFLYAAPLLHEAMRMPLTGWFSHAAPFAFEPSYRPAAGIARAGIGTPPILALVALEVGVDLLLEAPGAALRGKSLKLSDLFLALVRQECAAWGFRIVTPDDHAIRGSQVSLTHPEGYPIMQALIARGVIGDFRAPDILRFGLTPLYLRYVDVWDAVATLADIMGAEAWRDRRFSLRAAVT